mmetsp:Transcript_15473/g.33766  ORF Transcript_15473/g.33766 Transcript_15473/m.33766 type:complete len:207 (-) Transcript_15473:1171-1791(-)
MNFLKRKNGSRKSREAEKATEMTCEDDGLVKLAQPTTPIPPQQDLSMFKRSATASTDPCSDSEHNVMDDTETQDQTEPRATSEESFQVLESRVVEEGNGKPCTCDKVYRGTTRLETLKFQISQQLINLKRHVVTAKKMGFAFVTVSQEELMLGSFDASPRPVEVSLPPQQVPNTSLAKGKYRIQIKYTAENNPETLREEVVEFSIV